MPGDPNATPPGDRLSPPTRRLAELRGGEAAAFVTEGSTLILPVGAVGWWGPDLPLNTELEIIARCGEELVHRAGQRHDLFLLEPLAYGSTLDIDGGPVGFGLRTDTMLNLLDDLGRSVASISARNLVILALPTEQSAVLEVGCRQLNLHHRLVADFLPLSLSNAGDDAGGPGLDPATLLSMMRYLRPDILELPPLASDAAPTTSAVNDDLYSRFAATLAFGWTAADTDVAGLEESGASTAERGARQFERCVDDLVRSLDHRRQDRGLDQAEEQGPSESGSNQPTP